MAIEANATTQTGAEAQTTGVVEGQTQEQIDAAKAAEVTTTEKENKSLMDEVTDDAKVAKEAEEKRLLETPDDKLSAEDLPKKQELVKAKAEAEKLAKENIVPEKYEFVAPEGVVVDPEYVDKASVIMKKHNITQAAATELGNLAAEQIKKLAVEKEKQDKVNFDNFVNGLKKEALEKLGANAKQELAIAAKARDKFASKELIKKLNDSGLANDIDMINHFISIGKLVSEGKLVEGKSIGAGESDPLNTLYPKTAGLGNKT